MAAGQDKSEAPSLDKVQGLISECQDVVERIDSKIRVALTRIGVSLPPAVKDSTAVPDNIVDRLSILRMSVRTLEELVDQF